MEKLICFLLLSLCSVFAQTAYAEVPSFDAMYVFGDSLSDTGNDLMLTKLIGLNPAIPPSEYPHTTYFQGRFSNGPISFEYLWRLLKNDAKARVVPSLAFAQPANKGAVNYAFGGATSGDFATTPGGFPVPGLLSQVAAFRVGLFGRKPVRHALYAIWIGSNDYATSNPTLPATVVRNIKRSIQSLYRMGGREFIVLNMPDLGHTPAAKFQGVGADLTGLSVLHNTLLAQAVTDLSSLQGIKITSINIFTLAQNLVQKLELDFGPFFTNVPALGFVAGFCLLSNPAFCPDLVSLELTEPFFYWDVEHPTTYVHGILGQAMYDALQQ